MSPIHFAHQGANSILFLARSLDRGGAERQLVVLAKGLACRGHSVAVAVFFSGGAYESELVGTGVRVIHLGKKGRWDILSFLYRLVRLLRKERPAVLHSYLGVPNILAAALKPQLSGTRIVWGVRASNMDLSRYDWLSRLAYVLERRLAHFADCIIANSYAGKRYAVANGFPEDKTYVIPNGIDTERFRFDSEKRRQIRAEWGVCDDELLIGLVARLDPMKGHATFLKAAGVLAVQYPNLRFVCIGDGPLDYSERLKQQSVVLSLGGRLIWADARDDMSGVFSALDIASSSSSFGEGFSNTIAEAMACGLPCVVTDVGDSALIVSDLGEVASPDDEGSFARAMTQMLDRIKQEPDISRRVRERIEADFSLDSMVVRTERILFGSS